MRRGKKIGGLILGAALLLSLGSGAWNSFWMCPSAVEAAAQTGPSLGRHLRLLEWPENLGAVRYEVEIFDHIPSTLSGSEREEESLYRDSHIYSPGLLLDLDAVAGDHETDALYWRVRALDLEGRPISDFSALSQIRRPAVPLRDAPIPRGALGQGKGTDLLFPVYSFLKVPGASQYEIEVTDREPENPDGFAPSQYRVFSGRTELTDFYDPNPRIGSYWWRVRGLDSEGRPIGEWSEAQHFETKTEGWTVGVYGDSISHGGGHLSFGPADAAYSYESYLDEDVINLSESGDTSRMMADRFERDAAPFHLQYLFILGGTNSLRGGVPAEDVIADLKEIQAKARAHGMEPILMTLPPINPENIERAFQEPTADDWSRAFEEVNAFIRSEPHVDTAAPFAGMDVMPTELALDGIHGDWNAKIMMAEAMNEYMRREGIVKK